MSEQAFDDLGSAGAKASIWALPLLALGLSLVACAVLIPASEENRLAEADRRRLEAQVASLERRVEVNNEFFHRLEKDAAIARRLQQRTLPPMPDGEVAQLASADVGKTSWAMSPLAMLEVEPVEAVMAPPQMKGLLPEWCRDGRHRLAVAGTGLFACLIALLAGSVRQAG